MLLGDEAKELVHVGLDGTDGTGRGDRDGEDESLRGLVSDHRCGGDHGVAGGQSVVDEIDVLSTDGRRRTCEGIFTGAATQFGGHLANDAVDQVPRKAPLADHGLVEDDGSVQGDGAETGFGRIREGEFPGEDEVERGIEGRSELLGDGHASARDS
jgi:hypothetical protein